MSSIDNPLGGIFARLGLPGEAAERVEQAAAESFEVTCVKRIVKWALGDRAAQVLRTAGDEAASGMADLDWFGTRFSGFPAILTLSRKIVAGWDLRDLWGNNFAKHPVIVEYFAEAESQRISTRKDRFVLLTRVSGFSGAGIMAVHNIGFSPENFKLTELHDGGDQHNTRLLRSYRGQLYAIEDLLSLLALLGNRWADIECDER